MRTKLLGLLLLAGSSLFAESHWSISVGVGTPYYYAPPPPPVVTYAPTSPGAGYAWVPGYYYPGRAHYVWRPGYWSRPPHAGAYWVAPRYSNHHYYPGYWGRRTRDDHRRGERHDRGLHRGWDRHYGRR